MMLVNPDILIGHGIPKRTRIITLWVILTYSLHVLTEHLPRLIKSTSCDKHLQSLPVLCGLSQCPVDHLGDRMDQDSLKNVNIIIIL